MGKLFETDRQLCPGKPLDLDSLSPGLAAGHDGYGPARDTEPAGEDPDAFLVGGPRHGGRTYPDPQVPIHRPNYLGSRGTGLDLNRESHRLPPFGNR